MKKFYTVYNIENNLVAWVEEIDSTNVEQYISRVNNNPLGIQYDISEYMQTKSFIKAKINPITGEFTEGEIKFNNGESEIQ